MFYFILFYSICTLYSYSTIYFNLFYFTLFYFIQSVLKHFSEMEKWLSSHNKESSSTVLLGDINIPSEKLQKYILKNFPDWTITNFTGSGITYSKGSKSSCIDHIIYNKAMIPLIHLSSYCSFANDISDHYPIFLSCNKNLSDGFNKPKKTFKWSKHICNSQNINILSHNCFSVLASNIEFKSDETPADDMVKEFINSSISVGKEVKAFYSLQI